MLFKIEKKNCVNFCIFISFYLDWNVDKHQLIFKHYYQLNQKVYYFDKKFVLKISKIVVVTCATLFSYVTKPMRLCHPPDGSTSPKYKLLCFITTTKICKVKNALAFNWDRCCHLGLCLRLIPFHLLSSLLLFKIEREKISSF